VTIDVERYAIRIEGGPPSNYSAWSPDVQGCVATGDSIGACLDEMRSALAAHLELMVESGEALPDPSGPGVLVEDATAA
jgi:predicted RNase H-like HicB family nuclease